jgi:3-hydroxy acid dehydrogenase/malonic semialdehyde reductase
MKKKTVLVTGASSGFGYAIAEKFASEGYNLIIFARRLHKLKELYDKYKAKSQIFYTQLDVRNLNSIEGLRSELPDEFRNIDIIVNNAGLALGLEKAHEANLEDWITMIDTNIKGLVYFTRMFLPDMVKKNKGHIINMGSIAGSYVYPGGNVYCATKAFVKQFSLALKADLLGTNVRVTNIEPGHSETEFSLIRFHGDVKRAENLYRGTKPLRDTDIAEIVYFIASLPEHININRIEIMPVCQAFSPLALHREE